MRVVEVVRRFAITGAECSGKTTIALAVVSDLRRAGYRVAYVAEPGEKLIFDLKRFDGKDAAPWAYMVATKMRDEAVAELLPNVEIVVSDRTPLDHALYAHIRQAQLLDSMPKSERMALGALLVSGLEWLQRYDQVFFSTIEGVPLVADGLRQAGKNSMRNDFEIQMRETLDTYPVLAGSIDARITVMTSGIIAKL